NLQHSESLLEDQYQALEARLFCLEQLFGRAPPELSSWTLVIATDLSLTQGNVAACNIASKTVYLHPYFFELLESKQLEILYHELISHIARGITNEDEAMEDTKQLVVLSQAVAEIKKWKQDNVSVMSQRSLENPFVTKLQQAVQSIYNVHKLYALPIGSRLIYCNSVFTKAEYLNIYVIVNSLYQHLKVNPESIAALLDSEGYYYLAGTLSDLEGTLSTAENHNVRFAFNLIFDLWAQENRILEQKYLVQEINTELRTPGSGRLPLIAAVQDFHGGERRASSLVGFVLGLPADIYSYINNLDDLKLFLVEYGIDTLKAGVRFVGLNDKYDRGKNPIGVFNLVSWLREEGKAKPFIGNHDFWRAMSVLGVHFLFESAGIDFKAADVKNHHIAYWARDAFKHTGWGDIELDQVNQRRFNQSLNVVNLMLRLNGLSELVSIDLEAVRSRYEDGLTTIKQQNNKIRAQNELFKDKAGYLRQSELLLPDIFTEIMKYLFRKKDEYNQIIMDINNEHRLDLPAIEFNEVSLSNYWRDPEIIARTLWELKNFRLFYVDILGNLHMHNIVPIDYEKGGFAVEYNGLHGLPALELMAEDVRVFFQDLETIPDSMAFRRKMWQELGPIFTIINSWYSDIDAHAKAVSVKKFIDKGGLEGLGHEILGHVAQAFVDRESTFLVIWGHNERKKFGDMETALPWLYLYPSLESGIANIDFEMSEGYSDRGAVLTFFKRDALGRITGLRKWGYRKESAIIDDLTFEDVEGLGSEQLEMLKTLSGGESFMRWYKIKALKHMAEESRLLIQMAQEKRRPDKEVFAKMTLESVERDLDAAKREVNLYPLVVFVDAQKKAVERFGADVILTNVLAAGFNLQHSESLLEDQYQALEARLFCLEQLFGRAPPELSSWT
ncbi:MAG: hypothetical protein WCY09_10400, partial [Candidatus Omnitrophota bacterium]